MADIIIGTELKQLININKIGSLTMKDINFIIEVTNGKKTLSFSKSECIPENEGVNGYKICYDTANLGLGKIKIRVIADIPDSDFKMQTRREIDEVDPNINIVKTLNHGLY